MRTWPKKTVISGCEARGDKDKPYLTRYYLLKVKGWSVYFHKFHRSDHDDLHDHPWPFMSIILWRGYNEETHCRSCLGVGRTVVQKKVWSEFALGYALVNKEVPCWTCYGSGRESRRKWPGMVLLRPAAWAHRVVLIEGRPAYTLVVTGIRCRPWGFFAAKGWQFFKDYVVEKGC